MSAPVRQAADDPAKARLGRGLAALLGDVETEFGAMARDRGTRRVPIEFIRRNPRNPRTSFEPEQLAELAASVRERGIIQPILVRPVPQLPDVYEIVAGERRWRAAQQAGLHDVPVVVIEADERLALELAIIENVQRSDLNPIEEANGYEQLILQHGYSQTDLAGTLGKSRSHVANTLRLLKLPARIRELMLKGDITAGHGRALLAVDDPGAVAEQILARGLTVRDVERLGRDAEPTVDAPRKGGRPRRVREETTSDMRALKRELIDALGLQVEIESRGEAGELKIRFASLEQLDEVCRRLKASAG